MESIHEQFCSYGLLAKEQIRKCQMLLPLIAKYEIWKKKGFGSIYEYAIKLAGMSRRGVDETLWVLKKLSDKPALLAVAERKGLHSVRPIAAVATVETQDFWADKARVMPQKVLRTYVRELRQDSWVAPKSQPEKLDVVLNLEPGLGRRLEQVKKYKCFEERLGMFIVKLEKELLAEQPQAVRTESRYISAVIRNYIDLRSGGFCEYPRCTKKSTSLHHTQRFALEKVHDPKRLVALCTAHERLMHHSLVNNEEAFPETWSVLREPDKTDPKFYIDTLVSLYRPSG